MQVSWGVIKDDGTQLAALELSSSDREPGCSNFVGINSYVNSQFGQEQLHVDWVVPYLEAVLRS